MSGICGHGPPSEQIIFLYVDAYIYSGYIIPLSAGFRKFIRRIFLFAGKEGNLNYKYII